MTIANAASSRSVWSHAELRYYEQRALVGCTRTGGNQRRYPRWVLSRLAFIAAAQRVGLSLDQVRQALDTLPTDRAPRSSALMPRTVGDPWPFGTVSYLGGSSVSWWTSCRGLWGH